MMRPGKYKWFFHFILLVFIGLIIYFGDSLAKQYKKDKHHIQAPTETALQKEDIKLLNVKMGENDKMLIIQPHDKNIILKIAQNGNVTVLNPDNTTMIVDSFQEKPITPNPEAEKEDKKEKITVTELW